MITDDLSSLFAPNPAGAALPASYRMGLLVEFDASDGSNTIQIGSSTLTNLPLLVSGAEIGLENGDSVLVLYLGHSAMIVGKVATVGGPNYGATNSGKASITINNIGGCTASSAGVVVCTDSTIVVPGWATAVGLTMFGSSQLHNNTGATDALSSQVRMHTGAGDVFSAEVGLTAGVGAFSMGQAVFAAVSNVVPGETLTFTYTLFSNGNWTDPVGSVATMFAQLDFYRSNQAQ